MRKNIMVMAALLLTLALGLVGCGPSSNSKTTEASSENTKENTEKITEAPAADTENNWLGGYAEREIPTKDPTQHKYYVAGYRNENLASGILDVQKVKAVYLQAADAAVMWIAVDCVGLSAKQTDAIVKEANMPSNITVHVVSTHTHAGVDTFGLWGPIGVDGKDKEFNEQLTIKAGEAARAAFAARTDGRLFFGSTAAGIEDLQEDSRAPKIFDKSLYQIRFEAKDGSGFRIIDYAAHAEALRYSNSLISADYPRYLSDAVKKETGDDVLYIPGAIGGLVMTKRLTDKAGKELSVEENVVATGELLAKAALSIKNERELKAQIAQSSREVDIPLDNKVFLALTEAGVLTNKAIYTGDGQYGISVRTKVSLTRMGDLYIVSVPGELFPELAYGKGQQNGVEATIDEIISESFIVVGLCDDEIGYIVPPSDFVLDKDDPYFTEAEDHYEETNSVGPLAAELLLKAVAELYIQIAGD